MKSDNVGAKRLTADEVVRLILSLADAKTEYLKAGVLEACVAEVTAFADERVNSTTVEVYSLYHPDGTVENWSVDFEKRIRAEVLEEALALLREEYPEDYDAMNGYKRIRALKDKIDHKDYDKNNVGG